jgi:hypothetical protein
MKLHKGQIQRASSYLMGFLAEFWRDEEVGSVPDVTDVYVKWLKSHPPTCNEPSEKQKPRLTIRQLNTPA